MRKCGIGHYSGYYYKVRAYRTVNGKKVYGSYTSVLSAKPTLSAPASPKAASAGYNSVKLTWAKSDGATGYRVYRSTSENGTYTSVKVLKTLTYTDTGLTAGTTYYYKIRAYRTVDGANVYSGYSAAVTAKPVPAKTTLTVTKASATSAKLTWTKVAGATGYEVRRSTSKDGTYTLVKTTTGTSFTDSKLKANGTYYYKVRAYRTVSGKKVYGFNTLKSVSLK